MSFQKQIFSTSVCTLLVTSNLIALPFTSFTPSAQAQSRRVRYVPPSNLDAPKVTAAGITRGTGCEEAICFIALVPEFEVYNKLAPLTISERPTIYFLVPNIKKKTASFILKEVDDKLGKEKSIYRVKFDIPDKAGVMSFKLPEDAPALKANKNYTWQVFFNGENFFTSTVYGSVRRVEPSSKLAQQLKADMKPLDRATLLAQEGIWFEAIQSLVEANQSAPQDLEIKKEWTEVLKSVKLDKIIGQPILDCCKVKSSNVVNKVLYMPY